MADSRYRKEIVRVIEHHLPDSCVSVAFWHEAEQQACYIRQQGTKLKSKTVASCVQDLRKALYALVGYRRPAVVVQKQIHHLVGTDPHIYDGCFRQVGLVGEEGLEYQLPSMIDHPNLTKCPELVALALGPFLIYRRHNVDNPRRTPKRWGDASPAHLLYFPTPVAHPRESRRPRRPATARLDGLVDRP